MTPMNLTKLETKGSDERGMGTAALSVSLGLCFSVGALHFGVALAQVNGPKATGPKAPTAPVAPAIAMPSLESARAAAGATGAQGTDFDAVAPLPLDPSELRLSSPNDTAQSTNPAFAALAAPGASPAADAADVADVAKSDSAYSEATKPGALKGAPSGADANGLVSNSADSANIDANASAESAATGAAASATEGALVGGSPSSETTAGIPTPLLNETAGFDPWQSAGLVFGLLALLGAGGVALVRLKGRGTFLPSKQEKLMEIVGTLAIAPKRSVLLVRIKGEEFAISSTEHGITFLHALGQGNARASAADFDVRGNGMVAERLRESPSRLSRVARAAPPPAALESAATSSSSSPSAARADGANPASSRELASDEPVVGDGGASRAPKSDMLLSALRNMRAKAAQKETRSAELSAPEAKVTPPSGNKSKAAGNGSTSGNAAGSFPRYLANAFAEEGRREVRRGDDSTGRNAPDDEVQMESVTNLIREKLREMKPLA
jgi:flagellar biogenesis protein FliO